MRVVPGLALIVCLLSACGVADQGSDNTALSDAAAQVGSGARDELPDGSSLATLDDQQELAAFLLPLLPSEGDLLYDEELSVSVETKSEPEIIVDCEPSIYFDALLRRVRVGANVLSAENKTLLETGIGYADSSEHASNLITGSRGVTACSRFGDDETTVTELRLDLDRLDEVDAYIAIRHENVQAEYQWVLASRDNLLFSWESSAPARRATTGTLDTDLERLIELTLDDLESWQASTDRCVSESSLSDEISANCVGIDFWTSTVQL